MYLCSRRPNINVIMKPERKEKKGKQPKPIRHLLNHQKHVVPLLNMALGVISFLANTASLFMIVSAIVEFGFQLTEKQVLELPDVKERVDMYFDQQEKFIAQLKEVTKIHDKVAVIDLRDLETIYTGNRFMVYALWPEVEVSVHVAWGFRKQNTAVMIGRSIINRNSKVDIGELCLSYGGGGHRKAGTCQLDNDKVDGELPNIIEKLNGR